MPEGKEEEIGMKEFPKKCRLGKISKLRSVLYSVLEFMFANNEAYWS